MSGLVAFVVVHLALVAIVPRTLLPIITGRAEAPR
jgi:thiosulfate reductase cytochrome b subunit